VGSAATCRAPPKHNTLSSGQERFQNIASFPRNPTAGFQGLGELLLLDALKRVLVNTREVASAVVVVDAKDENARNFCLRYDFIPLPSRANRLFYPFRAIERLFGQK
jgi:hypothetical protein